MSVLEEFAAALTTGALAASSLVGGAILSLIFASPNCHDEIGRLGTPTSGVTHSCTTLLGTPAWDTNATSNVGLGIAIVLFGIALVLRAIARLLQGPPKPERLTHPAVPTLDTFRPASTSDAAGASRSPATAASENDATQVLRDWQARRRDGD